MQAFKSKHGATAIKIEEKKTKFSKMIDTRNPESYSFNCLVGEVLLSANEDRESIE